MKHPKALALFAILTFSTAALADDGARQKSGKSTFKPVAVKTIDIDGDGMLSAKELGAAMALLRNHRKDVRKAEHAKRIATWDANGDGKLAADERAKMQAARFAKLDANSDGYISAAEAKDTRLAKRFTKLDANSDGFLSKAELAAAKERGHKRGNRGAKGEKRGQRMKKGQKNGAAVLTKNVRRVGFAKQTTLAVSPAIPSIQ